MPETKPLQKLYGKEYYHAKKGWSNGYLNYDEFQCQKNHPWGFMVPKILALKQGGEFLDVGCALGYFLSFVPSSFNRFGSDISEFAIDTAKKRFPEINFKASDICEGRPFEKKFDVITAFDILEHCLNLHSAVRNIHSMLKDDGIFVAGMPVASRVHYLLAATGFSFITKEDSHINITNADSWRNFVFAPFFEPVEEFSLTYKRWHIPFIDLFRVFILKKK